MAEQKRFYWLKLNRDFFKRHDIRIIEAMPDGRDYVLFYLKMMCESVDHDGSLRFNESIPYTEDMLATITNTNVAIVKAALDVFVKLHIMEIQEDGTYFMPKVSKMIGSAVDNDNANRQRRFREKNNKCNDDVTASVTKNNADVTQSVTSDATKNNESKSKSKSKRKEQELEIEREEEKEENAAEAAHASTSAKPTKHSFGEYKHVKLTDEEHRRLIEQYGEDDTAEAVRILDEYIEEKGYKTKNHYLTMKKWVFNAVNERRGKRTASGSPQNKTAQQLDEFYDMAQSWAERGD